MSLYRFDINFRESAVVGIVGAGGIGATLNTAFDRYEFDFAAAILLIIIAIVMVCEYSLRLPPPLGAVMAVAIATGGTKSGSAARPQASWRSGSAGSLLVAIYVVLLAADVREHDLGLSCCDAPTQAADIAGRMVPPRWGYIEKLWRPIWDTLNIATLGTLLAIVLAVADRLPRGAQHHAERASCGRWRCSSSSRRARSTALIWALMLVTIIGPGVLAGIIAIALRSIGFIAKLLYEAIEEIDETPGRGGARDRRVAARRSIDYGIVPQVMPAFAGISVFRWDINIRESPMLGLVGAGGIGLQLDASLIHAGLAAGDADPAGHSMRPCW